jgi:hypothetical protein
MATFQLNDSLLDVWHPTMGNGFHLEHRNYGTLSIENPASNNWCTMVCPKCRYSKWPTDPNHQRRNYSPQLQVQCWTNQASQPSSNSTLESTCLPESKETPAIRSALQIHWKHIALTIIFKYFNNYRPGLLPIIYVDTLLSASPQAIVTQHSILLNVSLQITK